MRVGARAVGTLAAALLAVSIAGAAAESPADFFKGRTIRIVVGFGPAYLILRMSDFILTVTNSGGSGL